MDRAQTTPDLPENARVLMVRLSALGDVIFALETLATLKAERPDVRVDFLIEDRFAAILEDHPMIEELIVFPRQRWRRIFGHLRRLRRTKYDVLLDLHGILKSGLQVWIARARLKVGYAAPVSREGAAFAYHRRVVLDNPEMHRAECGGFLLRELGLEAKRQSAVLARRIGVPDVFADRDGTRVILHPGTSSFATFKRWPTARFAQLARVLVDAGMPVAVSYGPGESELFDAVAADVPEVLGIDGGKIGLGGMVEVLRQADVVVAADTGPLHIAAAVGTRVVALFGPKDAGRYGPRGQEHVALSHDVPCRPCRRRTCPSPQCVLGIEVDAVAAQVLQEVPS
jgi:lipopolysaccharide heptosyltransferase I